MDISPSGNYLATKYVDVNANYAESLQIFNLKTGALDAFVPLNDKVDRGIGGPLFHFTSDTSMITKRKGRSGGTAIVEIDILDNSLKQVTTIPATEYANFTISENRSEIYVIDRPVTQQNGKALTLDLNGLAISDPILPAGLENAQLSTIPYHPNHVFMSQLRRDNNFGSIVEMRTGEIAFDFDGAYTGISPHVIKVDLTPDGHLMVFSQVLDKSRKVIKRVDVWKKIEEK